VKPAQSLASARLWGLICAKVFVGGMAALVSLFVFAGADFNVLRSVFVKRWGVERVARFDAWRTLIESGAGQNEMQRVKTVNTFINQTVSYGDDMLVWDQADYWATPLETLGRGAGDCEDYVIAKYYALQLVGISADKLRLIYVQARVGAEGVPQAHMVLAYYPRANDEPLVLDNLVPDLRPASMRPDLTPVFSFNSQSVFLGTSQKSIGTLGSGRISKWEDLLRRARAEGF
jgi:predicted transglutaminase-like cysteine proteinase